MKSARFLFFVVGMIFSLSASAYDAKVNGIYYNLNKNDKTAEVTYGDIRYERSTTIPETISYENIEYRVTSIGQYAFRGCFEMSSITISNSVISIGEEAFDACAALSSVTFGNSLKSIGRMAFYGCRRLSTVTLPNSVISIGELAFCNCERLSSLTIGNSLTNIGDRAFISCLHLNYIEVDSENKKYDSRDNCNAIIETATNTLICGCSETQIPNSVTSIGEKAFWQNFDLTSITIPNSVKTIGNEAFYRCINLSSLTIGNSVTSIGDEAFCACGSLSSVTIPNSVTSIGKGAFSGCGINTLTLPNSITVIDKSAFSGCSNLTTITLPNSLTCINDSVFSMCTGLTSVTIPNSVTSIGDGAFYNCSGLTTLTLPNSVTSIGVNAFEACEGLISITIPNSVTSIGDRAFYYCIQLSSITIPNSVTSLGENVFGYCAALTSIVVDSENKKYDSRDNCNAIIETATNKLVYGCLNTVIPNSVTSIGDYAFNECRNLTSLTIPDNVTSIGDWTFEGCVSLTSINIPTGVTTIGTGAFYSCFSLTSITIPESVRSIGEHAFHDCSGLTSITSLITEVFTCPMYVFEGIDASSTILYVPPQLVSVYKNTTPWSHFYKIVGITDRTLKLTCMAGGKDVTSEVAIEWKNYEGDDLGSGSSVDCYLGELLFYSISLNDDLGHIYHEIVDEPITIGSDSVLVCHLQTIEKVKLSGRISAEDIDEKTATVHVKQMLNGKYEESYTTSANNRGEFSLEVYDDDTEVIISCDGYMDAVIHRNRLNGNGNLGLISLSPITGYVVHVNIETIPIASEDDFTSDLLPGGLYDLQLSLMNETTGSEITDFSVQYNGTIVINSGASLWDMVSVTAKSKNQALSYAMDNTFMEEGTSNNIYLSFMELGGISASYAQSDNNSSAGYLYDSNGALVTRSIYAGETLQLNHIQEGTYTLVSIGHFSSFSNIDKLSKLSELGLVEGKDYLSTQVEVYNGNITTISVGSIPELKESLFHFKGSLHADKATVANGWYVTLSAKVNIEKDLYEIVNNVYLTIDIPEGCQLVENSVLLNWNPQTYTINENSLSISLTKDQAQREVRFCVIPLEANTYNFTAYVAFDKEITTPRSIGVAQFESEVFSISLPTTTSRKTITVRGFNNPYSEVKVYDGDVKIGETTSNGDGTWSVACELFNAYNLSCHDVIAKAKTQDGRILTSEMKSVLYDESCITPTQVSMTFYNGWHKNNITVDFDLIHGTTSAKHYDFYNETDFTFIARFTRNDPELIDDVNFYVKASDGSIRILPALFDTKQQAWVATSRYDTDKLPQNVTVDYNCLKEDTDESRKDGLLDVAANLAACVNHIYNFIDENVEVEVEKEDESSALVNFMMPEGYYYQYLIEAISYPEAEQMMRKFQFVYSETETGGVGTYTETNDDAIIVTYVDLGEREAYRMTLSYSSYYAKKNTRAKARIKEFLADLGSSFVDGLSDIIGVAEYRNVNKDFKSMQKRLESYQNRYGIKRQNTIANILAKCSDGSYRLTKNQRSSFLNEMQTKIWPEEDVLIEKYFNYLEEYKKKLASSVATYMCTLGLGKYLKSAKFASSKLNMAFKNTLIRGTSTETSAELLGGLLGLASEKTIEAFDKIFDYQNFEKVKDKALSWSSKKNAGILKKYSDLNKRVRESYTSCKKENNPESVNTTDGKQEIFYENKDDNNISFTTPSVEPILDPSGFVYEAVLSNRLPNVTTTVYQKQQGNATKWNAEAYSQENPLVTDEAGFYRWDVPQGEWQVKYEKEGYETCYSEWLPVPPPQLDVNIGMKQTTPPNVKQMRGVESGITIEMSKYMLPKTLNEQNIIVKMDGASRNGHVEMLNAEQSPAVDASYVSKLKFVPEDQFQAGDVVYVTIKGDVESYCGIKMGADHTEKVVIEPEISAIILDSVLTVPYGGSKTIQVLVMPQQVSAGKVLKAHLSSDMIASVAEESIVIDENGIANLTLNGELPGGTLLTLSLDNTDVSAQSKVKVDVEYEVVSSPTPSIRNGEQVNKGTSLSLQCETPGAKIYYTLDGSCPCNEETRILYTGPFVLPEGVVIVKAIATEDYLYDSDVVTFVYQVNGSTGISHPSAENDHYKVSYADGVISIDGAAGASCYIYDVAGRELAGKQSLDSSDRLAVPQTDVYIICVKYPNGKVDVKKVTMR